MRTGKISGGDHRASLRPIGRNKVLIVVAATLVFLVFAVAPAFAAAPVAPVTSSPAQSITATSAVLEGTLNAGAEHWYFAYSPSQYGPECADDERTREEAVSGSLPATETAAITGLEPGRRYTFCLVASNDEGETQGNEVSFQTMTVEPQLTEERIVSGSVTPFDAAFEAELNPENRVTTYRFEYALTKLAVEKGEGTSFGEGALPAVYEQQATGPVEIGGGLKPATTYYYRVALSSAAGTTDGPTESFETKPLERPLIEAEHASEVTQTTAQLQGRIDPEFQNTFCGTWQYVEETVFLQHGFTDALETGCGPPDIGGGGGGEPVGSGTLALKPNTTYYYRVLAENASGRSEGPAQTFSSLPYPPVALTGAASAITASSASISGSVNPASTGPNSATTYYFQYGTTTGYGAQAPLTPGDAGEGESAVPETASLTGLQPGTTYHYRIVATNDNANTEGGAPQSDYGQDETFTTAATPPVLNEPIETQGSFTTTPAGGPTNQSAPSALPTLGGWVISPSIAELNAREAKEDKSLPGPAITKSLTRAQKLDKALKACRKKKAAARAKCEKAARKKFPTAKLGKKKGKAKQ